MNLEIKSYYHFALLSQAAYANFDQVDLGSAEKIQNALVVGNEGDFVLAEAIHFTDCFNVIAQKTNDATGFSGTLFQEKATGKYVIAFRGTQPSEWWDDIAIADIQGIMLSGIAAEQSIDAINWIKQLITPVGEIASQYVYEYIGEQIVAPTEKGTAEGLGYLANIDTWGLTGHSLGGHLADTYQEAMDVQKSQPLEIDLNAHAKCAQPAENFSLNCGLPPAYHAA